jgi:hypothetical protein
MCPSGIGDHAQVKVSVSCALASAFKEACAASGVSMSSALSKFMADYSHAAHKAKPLGLSTRRLRRAAMGKLVRQLELIAAAEESYRDSIPQNLQSSAVYETADESIASMEEAAEILASVY